jgi:hypothetical protein
MMDPTATTFTRQPDGSVTVDHWPEETLISEEFLEAGDPAIMRHDGERVFFSVANGEATYTRLGDGDTLRAHRFARLYGRLKESE